MICLFPAFIYIHDIFRNTDNGRLTLKLTFCASVRSNIRIRELEFVIHFLNDETML